MAFKIQRLERLPASELSRWLNTVVSAGEAPGVAVAFVQCGLAPMLAAAGVADQATGRPMTAEEIVPWFSVTKLFTATAVVRLAEQGVVDLDAPVRYYPRGFPHGEGTPAITLRHLLSHTAGFRNPIPVGWIHLAEEPAPSLGAVTERLLAKHNTLKFKPGRRFSYSNLGYLVLGRVIETVTGESFEDHIRKAVLAPLGMTDSGFQFSRVPATGYQKNWTLIGIASRLMIDARFRGTKHGGYVALRPFLVDGAPYGGLVGSVEEMTRFAEAFLNPSVLDARGVISAGSRAIMLAAARDESGRELPAGLGWHLGTIDGQRYANHLGGGGGFRSEVRLYPDLRQAVVVAANETSFDTAQISRLVLE